MKITRRQLKQICESYLEESVRIEEAITFGKKRKKKKTAGTKSSQESAGSGPISSGKYPNDMIRLLEKEMDEVGITNQFSRIALLSVVAKESGLKPKSEKTYDKTSVSRIKEIWPWLGKKYSDAEINDLKKSTSPSDGNQQPGLGLFDIVYGPERPSGRTYGNDSPGDGSRYRGRGFNQVTWKASYKKYAELSGIDIVSDPDKLNDPVVAAKVTVKFLANRLKQKFKTVNPEFTSQSQANEMLARANAGWGKGGSALSRAISSTNKESAHFKSANA